MDEPGNLLTAKRGRPSLVDSFFEEHRTTITRLWQAENKKLPDIIQFMETEHDFSATPKQYKKRLNDWGLRKNIRNCEMHHLARIKLHRDAQGKLTTFKLHGAHIDMTKIDRWIKAQREKLCDDDFMSSIQTAVSTPPEIVYDTQEKNDSAFHPEALDNLDESYGNELSPVASTSTNRHIAVATPPPNIRLPNVLQIPEVLLRTISSYFDAQFVSGVWFLDSHGEMKNVKTDNEQVNTFIQRFFEGYLAMGNAQTRVDGRRQLESAYALLESVLREESPVLVPYLICLHRHIHTSEAGLLLSCSLWNYTKKLAYKVLGSEHQITRILAYLGDAAAFQEQHSQFELIARFVANQLETRGDYRNPTSFKTTEAYVIASRIEAEASPTLAEASLQLLLRKLSLQDRPFESPSLSLATTELAYNLHRQNKDQEAKVWLTKLEADQSGMSLNNDLIRSRRLLRVIEAREESLKSYEYGSNCCCNYTKGVTALYIRDPCTDDRFAHHWGNSMDARELYFRLKNRQISRV